MRQKHEAQLYRKLHAMPEIEGFMLIRRHTHDLEEMWLFVVAPGRQLEDGLEANIRSVLDGCPGTRSCPWRVLPLTQLPLSRQGQLMRGAVERYVNDYHLPNRSRMKNPGVFREIAGFLKTHTKITEIS